MSKPSFPQQNFLPSLIFHLQLVNPQRFLRSMYLAYERCSIKLFCAAQEIQACGRCNFLHARGRHRDKDENTETQFYFLERSTLCASHDTPQCRSICGMTSLASISVLFLCRAWWGCQQSEVHRRVYEREVAAVPASSR